MFIVVRAITYATLFVGVLLIYVPGQILSAFAIIRPPKTEWQQITGEIVCVIGASIAVWCVLTFSVIGSGTPAPFDPPRHLVVRGPYRYVRNPMYIGAGVALVGASIYYGSVALAAYAGVFLLMSHLFVVLYEEPTLQRTFGMEYNDYCSRIRRWIPTMRSAGKLQQTGVK